MHCDEEWLENMWMKMTRLASGALLLMTACSSFSAASGKVPEVETVAAATGSTQGMQSNPQAVLELQNIQYDGGVLSGRLLVGALVDGVRLDKRLISGVDVNVDAVRDCADQEVPYVIADFFVPAAREEDLLVLDRGYWYGAPARLRLFFEPGPDCIKAEISLLSFDGKSVASVWVRAERISQQSGDAGIPEERQPPDAGVP